MTQLINDIHETAQRQYSNEPSGSIKLGGGCFWTSQGPISFSCRTPLNGVRLSSQSVGQLVRRFSL